MNSIPKSRIALLFSYVNEQMTIAERYLILACSRNDLRKLEQILIG